METEGIRIEIGSIKIFLREMRLCRKEPFTMFTCPLYAHRLLSLLKPFVRSLRPLVRPSDRYSVRPTVPQSVLMSVRRYCYRQGTTYDVTTALFLPFYLGTPAKRAYENPFLPTQNLPTQTTWPQVKKMLR